MQKELHGSEENIMNLIVMSGQSRSLAFEALAAAEEGDFARAEKLLAEAAEVSIQAHEMQTELIQSELNGQEVPLSLIMVHAQDHLMDSILARELVERIIVLHKKLAEK